MNRQTYWTYQLAGWSVFAAIGLVINVLNGGYLPSLIVGHILLVFYGIGLTHLFRRLILGRQTPPASRTRKALLRSTCILIIGTLLTLLVIATDYVVSGSHAYSWPWSAVAGMFWGMCIAAATWSALYVQIIEGQMREEHEAQSQLALREAELRVLESQVNPHFLFNCLNSIRALVIEDPPRAQDMVTRLANVMRHSLRHDRQHTVPLAIEVEAVADYLALEGIRFEERLNVKLSIDPAAQSCRVPPMLLQTLVENAIKHGISHATGGGDVFVRAVRENGIVRLEVENTGRLSAASSNTNPLGLANARERLRLLYGESASLTLRNGEDHVTATVVIPAA
jgi:two-component system, LytTR family, sensor kinase